MAAKKPIKKSVTKSTKKSKTPKVEVLRHAATPSQGNLPEASKSDSYSAKDIQVLEGLKPVRKRPGMYIGSTGIAGLHHLIWEIVDNSIDEAMAGHATKVSMVIHKDATITVEDDGRGIPVDKHPITKKSALETIMTTLHAGGKFGGGGYKVSGGLHGVGASVVNALSEWMKVEVGKGGRIYTQEYKQGDPITAVKQEGATKWTGTRTTWKADKEIFENTTDYNYKTIVDHLRQQAYLTKGVIADLLDERTGESEHFKFDGGIKEYVIHLAGSKNKINEPPFYVDKAIKDHRIEISLQYTEDFSEDLYAFANNIHNTEGGTHVVGFRAALTRTLNNYGKKNNLIKENGDALTGEDVREGLVAVISVKLPDPQFEGQTKSKLGNTEIRTMVEGVMNDYFG
ncbi:MAG: ATP-binding protein, partial [Patescibacteria group bacterium]